jgi:hypothetical protein
MPRQSYYSSHTARLNASEETRFTIAFQKWAKDRDLTAKGAFNKAVMDAVHEAVMDWINKIEKK